MSLAKALLKMYLLRRANDGVPLCVAITIAFAVHLDTKEREKAFIRPAAG